MESVRQHYQRQLNLIADYGSVPRHAAMKNPTNKMGMGWPGSPTVLQDIARDTALRKTTLGVDAYLRGRC